jgi:hypothetical protein
MKLEAKTRLLASKGVELPTKADTKSVSAFLKSLELAPSLIKKLGKDAKVGPTKWEARITNDESSAIQTALSREFGQPASAKRAGSSLIVWKRENLTIEIARDGEANRSLIITKKA